ncbi:threonine synthase [Paenibacillus sp. S150]|uniref:threonine synthase n=1 Tax=Paenibacillus sp. S150 TaxID=2749826 RepID=UPI001C55C54E|nr:threonine synthase [Paenibacillus sp. S150]MBW4084066.1 threonine synthase [Paenibacillus sp. S150]
MRYSYLSHLECPQCGETYGADAVRQLCACGSPLLVRYDLEQLKLELDRAELSGRQADLWRYHELLPVVGERHVVTLGEGMTPLLELPRLGGDYGIKQLLMKDESLVPSGSFKARGAAVGVSKAKELGVAGLAMPTNGNAGAAWALYSARAGIEATIVMPQDAPKITRSEVALAGARLYLVNGLISDAGKIVAREVADKGLYDASTLKEPYRIEGKKTMGLEIAEQLGWEMPDVILYPTGGGVGLIGIYKALQELREIGWVQGKLPRLVAVQAEGCAPIVKAWEAKAERSEFWPDSATAAFGINVPKALGDFLVLKAVYETDGAAVAVSDEEMGIEQEKLARLEGSFVCPEGAAAFAAARRLARTGWIKPDERVVVLNTGAGIKYPDSVQVNPPLLEIGEYI